MINHDVINTFKNGPQIHNPCGDTTRKRKPRRSKLQLESENIIKFWTDGKSLQFICHRLHAKSIFCARSTVLRFIRKNISL